MTDLPSIDQLSHLCSHKALNTRTLILLLCEQNPCDVSTLTEKCHCTPAAITGLLDTLIFHGQVRKERDGMPDRRSFCVVIMPPGKELLDKLRS